MGAVSGQIDGPASLPKQKQPQVTLTKPNHDLWLSHFTALHYSDCAISALSIVYNSPICCIWGTRWYSWLRHCATSRKVAGSIPNGVIEIFH